MRRSQFLMSPDFFCAPVYPLVVHNHYQQRSCTCMHSLSQHSIHSLHFFHVLGSIHTDKVNTKVVQQKILLNENSNFCFFIAIATRLKNQKYFKQCESGIFMFVYFLPNFIPLLSVTTYKETLTCFSDKKKLSESLNP